MRRSGALIELKRGGSRNFFLVHDGDGETLLYLNLARRMPEELTVIGVEPHRIARVPLAHTRIEDMAAWYIEEMRKRQPFGPYLLGGMCAGGVIAYEMASQLVRAGEHVELLALLDAATPQAPKIPGRATKQRLGRLRQLFTQARNTGRPFFASRLSIAIAASQKLVNALAWEMTHRVTLWSVRARFRLLQQLLPRQWPWPWYLPELSVRQIYDSAEALYKPKSFSPATVVLLRARAGEGNDTPYREIYADETFGWGSITHALTVVDVDGGHSSMLQDPFVESLVSALMPPHDSSIQTNSYTLEA
jgi:thioesterase domain-containing protein